MKQQRTQLGLAAKRRSFAEGFGLLREMALRPVSRRDAEIDLAIPTREWYRWLTVYRELGIPLAESARPRPSGIPERTLRLWRADWERLIR